MFLKLAKWSVLKCLFLLANYCLILLNKVVTKPTVTSFVCNELVDFLAVTGTALKLHNFDFQIICVN